MGTTEMSPAKTEGGWILADALVALAILTAAFLLLATPLASLMKNYQQSIDRTDEYLAVQVRDETRFF